MPPSEPSKPGDVILARLRSISRYSKPSSPTRIRIARSRYLGSMYFSHRSGGSRICPSASMTRASAGIILSSKKLENRDRIHRRAGPAFEDQRRHGEHEFVTRMLLGLLRQRIEIRVVDQMDALHHQRADVNRQHQSLVTARHHVAH